MDTFTTCFHIGSTVRCVTCFDDQIVGTVESFDHHNGMLMLRCECTSPSPVNCEQRELCDLKIVNLSLCKSVELLKELAPTEPVAEPPINIVHVHQRFQKMVKERSAYLSSLNAQASVEGQELFQLLAKQFGQKEVTWQGENIQVLDQLSIASPYEINNITTSGKCQKLLLYVQRVVAHFRKQQAQKTEVTAEQVDDNAKIQPAAK